MALLPQRGQMCNDFAALERRVTKLESNLQEIDCIVDPQNLISVPLGQALSQPRTKP